MGTTDKEDYGPLHILRMNIKTNREKAKALHEDSSRYLRMALEAEATADQFETAAKLIEESSKKDSGQ